MRPPAHLLTWLLLAAGGVPSLAHAQSFSANYEITRAASVLDSAESALPASGFALGQVRVARAFSMTPGAGLSIEAGEAWFGRLTLGRSVESDLFSLGGGFRFRDGQSVSMQFSRSSQDRLGLSVRYDWPRYYVRLGVDRDGITPDMLRFSAGMRF